MVNDDSVRQSAGLEEPKSESPEAENLVYSVPPSNPGTPRDIDRSRVEREAISIILPTPSNTRSVLQKHVNNLTADDSFGPLLKTANTQNQTASGGSLSRPSSLAKKSISGPKKYKRPRANDPNRDPYDIADTDAGSSQELPHMQVSKKAKQTHSPIANSPLTMRPFSHINEVGELSKEVIDSSRRSLSESPVQIAAPVLQSFKPAGHYAANPTLTKDAPLEVEKTGPKIGISQGGGLLRGRKSGASLLQKEGPGNTPIVYKEKDCEAREEHKIPEEPLGIERRSELLGVAEKDSQERLCMAAKAKSAKTSEAASSETPRPGTSNNSKDDSFEAEDIPKGRVKGNRKAPPSDRSSSEDTAVKQKMGGDAAESETTVKDKPSKATMLAEDGKSQGSKPKGGSQHPTGENNLQTRDNEQVRRAKEAELHQESARQDTKQPPSRFSSSTPKPAAGKRSSVTPMIPMPRSAKKTPTSAIRTSSISSKGTPSRTMGTNPAKTGPSEITRSSPTEQRRSVTFADDRSDVSQPSVLPGATLINGRAREKAGTKSVTHKAKISKKLDESPTLSRPEPPPSSISERNRFRDELFQRFLKPTSQTTLDVTRDKGKQVVRDPPLPLEAAHVNEVIDSLDSNETSAASRQEIEQATSKLGSSRGRSKPRGSPANPTLASTKKSPTLQSNATTGAKSTRKDMKKPISKPTKAADQQLALPIAMDSSTSFKKDSAKKESEKPLLKSTKKGRVGKSIEQPLDKHGKDATTSPNRITSLDRENRVAHKDISAGSKSQSRSPAREVFSSASSAVSETGSETESDSDSEGESESEEQSALATNSGHLISNDAGKPHTQKSAKPSKDKTEVPATSSRSGSDSEEDDIPLPKPRPQPNPISRNKHTSPKTLEKSTKSQGSHHQTDSETESDEDSPGRQLQREEKQSSQARITSTTSEVASTSRPPQNGPKTPLATSSSQAPVNSRFQPMSSIAASTAKNTANGQLTTRLPDYKMPLKSPVTPAAKALMDGARDEETSEEDSSSSDEDEDEEVEVGKGGGVRGVTRSSQDSGKGGKNSFLDMLKCEYFFVRCLGMLLIVF